MNQERPVVVIDPGHGGLVRIGGSSPNRARGSNGLLERDLTLDLAKRIERRLAGVARPVLTRSDDTNSTLATRAAVARDREAALFLSLHFNGAANPETDGTQIFVARDANPKSRAFARALMSRLTSELGTENRGIVERDLGTIATSRHAPGTGACLVEISYLTNPDQMRRLEADGYRDRVADAIATATKATLEADGNGAAPPVAAGTQRSEAQIAPAVVSAGAAVAGVGFNILKEALTNAGDISWRLSKVDGELHPEQHPPLAGDRWVNQKFRVRQAVENWASDEISAEFEVRYQYNGHALGSMYIVNVRNNDALGWGLEVTTETAIDRNVYVRNGNAYAALDLVFTYRFFRSLLNDVIYVEGLQLCGDGYVIRKQAEWTQD